MNKTLLLVDDEINIVKSLTRTFKDTYQIYTASNGEEALKILADHPIQVIISDQRMPRMTGTQLFTQVKSLYPDTVRILLSAYTDFDSLREAINQGAIYQFINKPYEEDNLLRVVNEAFKQYEKQIRQKDSTIKDSLETEELLHQIYFDKLTGLSNRYIFNKQLDSRILNAKTTLSQLAIVQIEIDRFSNINDSLGYQTGNAIVQHVTSVLKTLIDNEKNLSRLNANEFALLISDFTDPASLNTFLGNLIEKIKAPIEIVTTTLSVCINVGAAIFPLHGDNSNTLMNKANLAMLNSKESGGNNYKIYQTTMATLNLRQLELESDLFQALEKNQLVIYYQPIVSIENQQIVGVEALLRWQHPKYHLLTPDYFIPLCEACGLIIPIGNWVIETVCHQIQTWRRMGFDPIFSSINLSARQFKHSELLKNIVKILDKTQIPPASVKFEVTESLIMQDIEKNSATLQELRSLGVQLAIDDFGTGYSSLSYLQSFPFNILKIDKSFIQDIADKKESRAIVSSIIKMGKSLGLTIIAEGIETQQQLNFLKKSRCDYVQGYLLSRPVPLEKFINLLEIQKKESKL